MPAPAKVTVVGIGADGWDGLSRTARDAVRGAGVVLGSPRQLALLDAAEPPPNAQRSPLPSPLLPELFDAVARLRERGLVVLASGDPMFHGIGVTLARELGADQLTVHPQPSSVSLAAARLGWALHETTVVSLVARPVHLLAPELVPGARLLILAEGSQSVFEVAELLTDNGFGDSEVTVLSQLGGPDETVTAGTAQGWQAQPDPLNIVAVVCRGTGGHTRIPGLPDGVYESDGQLTKREVRALTLAALAPLPGERLWDVGGGTGSIAIEWMRTDPRCRATIFERDAERRARITRNANTLGVSGLDVRGAAPQAFSGTPGTPDAVFVGGGVSSAGLLDACWARLRPGGRMVVNAVTLESESTLTAWNSSHPGELTRLQVHRAGRLGSMTTWRPQLPVTQWIGYKQTEEPHP